MKRQVMAGQLTLFDLFVSVPAKDTAVDEQTKPLSLTEFEKRYMGYVPKSFDELSHIVELLADLINESYCKSDVIIDDFRFYCRPLKVDRNDDVHYSISWLVRYAGSTDETKCVHCSLRRLKHHTVEHWREGEPFICTASAHTTKKTQSCLAWDESIFCDHVSDIVDESLRLLKKTNSSARKSVNKLSPIQKFIKENDGRIIEDQITETSKDFKSFCAKLKNALKKEALLAGFDDVTVSPSHYDMSGFMKKGSQYIYWHFGVERYDNPTDLKCSDPTRGVLYRTAKSNKDYTGGYNHYTSLANLVKDAGLLLEKGGSL